MRAREIRLSSAPFYVDRKYIVPIFVAEGRGKYGEEDGRAAAR